MGTGGPEGGPTGLFTIYDGSTLRRGEFTFSIAYSNYDRDPGNVDIVDVPLSFNVGLNDHVELFFKTNGYRGIKVNNPQNLSSFYLPNSQLYLRYDAVQWAGDRFGAEWAERRYVSQYGGISVRLDNQPFVQYPFVGGSAGTFGLTLARLVSSSVSRVSNALLGPLRSSRTAEPSAAADNYPGIGSPVGSILPGIVVLRSILHGVAW